MQPKKPRSSKKIVALEAKSHSWNPTRFWNFTQKFSSKLIFCHNPLIQGTPQFIVFFDLNSISTRAPSGVICMSENWRFLSKRSMSYCWSGWLKKRIHENDRESFFQEYTVRFKQFHKSRNASGQPLLPWIFPVQSSRGPLYWGIKTCYFPLFKKCEYEIYHSFPTFGYFPFLSCLSDDLSPLSNHVPEISMKSSSEILRNLGTFAPSQRGRRRRVIESNFTSCWLPSRFKTSLYSSRHEDVTKTI